MSKFRLSLLLTGLAAITVCLFLRPSTVQAADEVAVPLRDTTLLTTRPDVKHPFAENPTIDNLQVLEPVYGLTTWKINATKKSVPSAIKPQDWGDAQEAYEVGDDTWLTTNQVLVIPQDQIVDRPSNFADTPSSYEFVAAAIDNNGPVALWNQPNYAGQPKRTVDPGTIWKIARYYCSPTGELWFDLGDNNWINAYYVANSLLYAFKTKTNAILYNYETNFRNPITVTATNNDGPIALWQNQQYKYFSQAINPGSQWQCYSVYYYPYNYPYNGETTWYNLGDETNWLPAYYSSLANAY
ncbi:MAG: hypothetical protein LKF36_08820 [Lactobacillus sp.]|nr:hypothetical protein [Lactobacillus sp.]